MIRKRFLFLASRYTIKKYENLLKISLCLPLQTDENCSELGRIEPSELTREGSSKPYALFISSLAERCPRLMFGALTPITFFLDSDVSHPYLFILFYCFRIDLSPFSAADATLRRVVSVCRYRTQNSLWISKGRNGPYAARPDARSPQGNLIDLKRIQRLLGVEMLNSKEYIFILLS